MSIKSFALAALLALPLPAMAQSTSNTAASNAVTVNSNAVLATNPGTSTQNVHYSGQNSVYTTPSVQGSYFAGANACLVGVGGGAAGGPVGLNFMWGRNDEDCNRRSDAGAWHALGLDNAALARMCQDRDNADAFFAATGKVCPGVDAKRYEAKLAEAAATPQMAATQEPSHVPSPVVPVVAAPPTPMKVQAGFVRPKWCDTLSPAERVSYKLTCG